MIKFTLLSLLAGVISLDVTAFGQFMVCRPIVVAPLFGYLLGDMGSGLWMGMIIEMLWVRVIPMGAAVPSDTTTVAILTVIWGATTVPEQHSTYIVALLIAIPAGLLFRYLDVWIRFLNIRLSNWVEEGIRAGQERRIGQAVYIGLFLFFAKAFTFYVTAVYAGYWIMMNLLPRLPVQVINGLDKGWQYLPVAGLAVMLVHFHNEFLSYK